MKLPINFSFVDLRIFRDMAAQLNGISEGRMSARHTAATAAPTTGTWEHGDFVYNSNPSELISDGLSYVVLGWECTVSGTPGTWVEFGGLTATGGSAGGRWGRGIDTTDDVIIDNSAKGLVLKSPNAHYWRVQVTDAGALTVTDLGLTKP